MAASSSADGDDLSKGKLPNLWSILKFKTFIRTGPPQSDNVLLRRPITADDPLPDGWEVRLSDRSSPFFVDHVNRKTTYADPRPLPLFMGLRVLRGTGLCKMDTFKKGDPRVLMRLRNSTNFDLDPLDLTKPMRHSLFMHTEVKKNTREPVWDESFFYRIEPTDYLEIFVYDWERSRKDELMGYILIPVLEVLTNTIALDDNVPVWEATRPLGVPPPQCGVFKPGVQAAGTLTLQFLVVGYRAPESTDARRRRRLEIEKQKLLCKRCLVRPVDAVNAPCGHAFFCAVCADAFRTETGAVCNTCRAPSTIVRVVTEQQCAVCYEQKRGADVFCIGDCGHVICVGCCVHIIRAALGNVNEQFPVRCPCLTETDRCPAVISLAAVQALRTASMIALDASVELTSAELERFNLYNNIAAIPVDQRVFCINADCGGMLINLDGCAAPTTIITCAYCNTRFCFGCRASHDGIDCAAYAQSLVTSATMSLIGHTSKPCPNCGTHITHYAGHACHHISPGRGCPACSTHFCYACGNAGWPCRNGCSPYCTPTCGCPICPDCKPGRPCPHCSSDFRCVSCNPPATEGGAAAAAAAQ